MPDRPRKARHWGSRWSLVTIMVLAVLSALVWVVPG